MGSCFYTRDNQCYTTKIMRGDLKNACDIAKYHTCQYHMDLKLFVVLQWPHIVG